MDANSADFPERGTPPEPGARNPWWAWGCSAEVRPGDLANYRRFNLLFLAWGVVFVLVAFFLDAWADALGPLAYAVALVPTLLFVAGAVAYGRFLRHADELTRKIHVEGMAVGFGTGLTVLLGYPLLEGVGAPPMDLETAVVPAVLAYVVGLFRAQRRYR